MEDVEKQINTMVCIGELCGPMLIIVPSDRVDRDENEYFENSEGAGTGALHGNY